VARRVNTGMFQTVLPEHWGDLLQDVVERISETRFVELTSVARDRALSELSKQGLPSKPQPDDLLKAPAHIFEMYQLLEAGKELETRLEPLVRSLGVLKAIAAALVEKYGDAPRQMRGELIVTPSDESGALEELWHIVDVAIELGVFVQRLHSRQHEPDVVLMQHIRKGGKMGSKKTHSPEKRKERERERRKYRAEYARLKKAHPDLSRTSTARQVGKTFGVDERTILRYTTSPKKN
jgi:hypothetical protein